MTIKEPMAHRELFSGKNVFTVTLGKPFEAEDDYICEYLIDLGETKKHGRVIGMDSVQAIQLVMKRIGVELSALSSRFGEPISWLKDAPGETGFPT